MINYIKVNKIRILVTVILLVSIFMFQYSEEANAIDLREEYDADTLYERNSLPVFAWGDGNMSEKIASLRFEDCTMSIVENVFYLDAATSCYMADVIVYGNDYFLPIIKGAYPDKARLSTGAPCAVLGKELYKYTYNQKGKTYIDIHGEKYEVTGFVAAPNSAIYDNRLILFYDCLGDNVRSDLEYYYYSLGFTLIFNSNTISAKAISDLIETDEYTNILPGFQRFVESQSIDPQYRKYANLIYIFSIATVILIVHLWMLLRKREFAIKKAFGYSTLRLICEILTELLLMLSIAIALSELGLMIFNLLEHELIWFSSDRLIFRLINIFKYTLITLPALLIVPAITLITHNPVKLLTDKDV